MHANRFPILVICALILAGCTVPLQESGGVPDNGSAHLSSTAVPNPVAGSDVGVSGSATQSKFDQLEGSK